MRSHFVLSRGAAVACAVSGATAMMNNISSAAFSAADYPTDPAYADGWQVGDNGGYGFTGWGMNGTYTSANQFNMSTSPYNPLGTPVWTLFNPVAPDIGDNNPPGSTSGGDIVRAGRGIIGGLGIGQTISTTIANPTETRFFRGYTIRLVSGGKNTEYAGTAVSRLAVGTFEYFTYGKWYTPGGTSLLNTDTAAGMRLDVTLTGADSYSLTMTPFGNPLLAHSESGSLSGTGAIDWIEFEFYNTDSDWNPGIASNPGATDFYVNGITISAVPEPSTGALFGLGAAGLLFLRRRK